MFNPANQAELRLSDFWFSLRCWYWSGRTCGGNRRYLMNTLGAGFQYGFGQVFFRRSQAITDTGVARFFNLIIAASGLSME